MAKKREGEMTTPDLKNTIDARKLSNEEEKRFFHLMFVFNLWKDSEKEEAPSMTLLPDWIQDFIQRLGGEILIKDQYPNKKHNSVGILLPEGYEIKKRWADKTGGGAIWEVIVDKDGREIYDISSGQWIEV